MPDTGQAPPWDSKRTIHRPSEVTSTEGDLSTRNEITIYAQPSVVWRRLVEVAEWPRWYPNVQDLESPHGADGLLDHGTRFAFETFGGRLQAVVDEFVPYSRLVWSGANTEIRVTSTWLLRIVADGCHVVSEGSANGPGAIAIREAEPQALYRHNELLISALKRASESLR